MWQKLCNPVTEIKFLLLCGELLSGLLSLQKKSKQCVKAQHSILMYTLWSFWGNAHFKCKQLCPHQSVQFKQLKEVMGRIIWQSSVITGFRPQQLKISCGVTNSSRVGAIIVSARGGWWGLCFKNSQYEFPGPREANTITLFLLYHPMKQTSQQAGAGGGLCFWVGTRWRCCRVERQSDSVSSVIY